MEETKQQFNIDLVVIDQSIDKYSYDNFSKWWTISKFLV